MVGRVPPVLKAFFNLPFLFKNQASSELNIHILSIVSIEIL